MRGNGGRLPTYIDADSARNLTGGSTNRPGPAATRPSDAARGPTRRLFGAVGCHGPAADGMVVSPWILEARAGEAPQQDRRVDINQTEDVAAVDPRGEHVRGPAHGAALVHTSPDGRDVTRGCERPFGTRPGRTPGVPAGGRSHPHFALRLGLGTAHRAAQRTDIAVVGRCDGLGTGEPRPTARTPASGERCSPPGVPPSVPPRPPFTRCRPGRSDGGSRASGRGA